MNNSRRTFIKNSSIILAGAGLLPHNNTLAMDKKEKLGIQLFSIDKEMHTDAPNTLRWLKKIGYNYVEHADYASRKFYGYSPKDFKNLIKDNGLSLLGGHTVLKQKHWNAAKNDFTKEWYNTIDDAALAQQQCIISPWLEKDFWDEETEFKKFMDVFNKSGELCKKAGLQFGYHNHDFEFTHTFNSLKLYDIILQQTDPGLVYQQLDIGNSCLESDSIKKLINKYPGRFQSMHVKDLIASGERHRKYKSTIIGEGILDLVEIISLGRNQGGTCNFIIDQDDFSNNSPITIAAENFKALNNIRSINTSKANLKIA